MKNITKLCVYAICKNESRFIDRWVESLQNEADCVVVLDTGSTDDSVEKLKKYEPFVTVKQYDYLSEVGYFRFDKARNDSLNLVPNDIDICVVLDLDQIPREGWSKIIKDRFEEGYTEIIGDIIDHNNEGKPISTWKSRNVHPNSRLWSWDRVIHECLEFYGNYENKIIYDNKFIIDHYPDENKDRSNYIKLLKYACEKYPTDSYYGIYLGIELSKRYDPKDAFNAFRRCLSECDFTNTPDIKYQCYLNIALCCDDLDMALDYLFEAEYMDYPKTRRLYKLFADVYEKLGEYDKAIDSLLKALDSVPVNSNDWKEDYTLFNGYIEDRLSLFYYYQKQDYLKSIEYCVKALSYNKDDQRLISNLKFYTEKYFESRGI